MTLRRASLALSLGLVLFSASFAADGDPRGPRIVPEGHLPNDRRLGNLIDLNGPFPFDPPSTLQAWEERASEVRQRVLVATGLWPLPEKTPLQAKVWGHVERDGFTVEKVAFQSVPGHFVTGLLFRPRGKQGPFPGVLSPHGHGGRLQDHGDRIRQLIVEGRERFEGSGRFPKLARCAQLARMGCVTFIYDMIGYADSVQIPFEVAHQFRTQRPHLESKDSWGFYSTQAELRSQSIMGVQAWNSVRSLDFLASLPDVDTSRLAVTGGSGGATQSILLCAIDQRPVVSFPQGMVSTSMQGGCPCENACLLRVGSGNVELTALFAPKPLGMTAADDWTRAMMTKGYPPLQKLYSLYGVKDKVFCKSLVHFPHNYNYVTRALMYSWFNTHLRLGLDEPIVEEDFVPLTLEERTVWDAEHPKPSSGEAYERSFTRLLDERSRRQLAALEPKDNASLERYREVVGGAIATMIGRAFPSSDAIERVTVTKNDRREYLELTDLLRFSDHGEELPVIWLYPKATAWTGDIAVWIDGTDGKAGLYDDKSMPRKEIARLLDAGTAVLGADLLYQGEFLADGKPLVKTRKVADARAVAGYTFTYNHSLFARRVHDIMTLVSYVRSDDRPRRVDLVGVRGAAPWVAAASVQAGDAVTRVAVNTEGFRFADLSSFRDPNFLPGAVKYGDLPGLLSLSAPRPLWIAGETDGAPRIVKVAYNAAQQAGRLVWFSGSVETVPLALADWLAKK